MHRIETMALAEHIGRRLRRTADAAELGDTMGRQAEFVAGVNDRGADRIVATAGAKRRDGAFIVAMGEAEGMDLQRGMLEFRFGQISHETASRVSGAANVEARAAISRRIRRAVIGVPS